MQADPAIHKTLARRLRRVVRGDVLFDAAARGRYATDGSMFEVDPVGVVVPADDVDVEATFALARELGVPLLPRGAGTGRCGDVLGAGLVIDASRHLTRIGRLDRVAQTIEVEPGVVLERLNAMLRPQGLWFPVDADGAAQATIGGLAGCNAWGLRAGLHGGMVHNVRAIDALLVDGTRQRFGPFGVDDGAGAVALGSGRAGRLVSALFELAGREQMTIAQAWPQVECRAAGYNLDIFHPASPRPYTADGSVNLAHLLIGSRGTLAWSSRLTLSLARLPAHRVLGVIRFANLIEALRACAPMQTLRPSALELLDRPGVDARQPDPGPVSMLVEFSGDDLEPLTAQLMDLQACLADAGFPVRVEPVTDAAARQSLWQARQRASDRARHPADGRQALTLFDQWSVPVARLADFAEGVIALLRRHQVDAVWCGNLSVGALQFRPLLDLRVAGPDGGLARLQSIRAGTAALIAACGGAGKGGEGATAIADLLCTDPSRWQYGERLGQAFAKVKALFDPDGLLHPAAVPGLRHSPGSVAPRSVRIPIAALVDRCDGRGDCRAGTGGAMCPSFRVTGRERDLPRGRANTVRQALAGRFGADGLASDAVQDALSLCVGCKACRSECPASVDIARVRLEARARRAAITPPGWRDRMVAALPRRLARLAALPRPLARLAVGLIGIAMDWREQAPWLARMVERWTGVAAARSLPRPRWPRFTATIPAPAPGSAGSAPVSAEPADGRDVVLFADTFNDNFEPQVLQDAVRVLRAGGYRVHVARPDAADATPARPLCCGRTWLETGQVDAARAEAARTVAALRPWVARGAWIVGLEPACLLALQDEVPALGIDGAAEVGARALLFESFLDREHAAGRLALPLRTDTAPARVLVQPHCHQQACGAMPALERVLRRVPGLSVALLPADCCGMAGAFGYQAEHYAVSIAMAERALLPAVRAAAAGDRIVADGTSCRHQIRDGAGRPALHVAQVLAAALAEPAAGPGTR